MLGVAILLCGFVQAGSALSVTDSQRAAVLNALHAMVDQMVVPQWRGAVTSEVDGAVTAPTAKWTLHDGVVRLDAPKVLADYQLDSQCLVFVRTETAYEWTYSGQPPGPLLSSEQVKGNLTNWLDRFIPPGWLFHFTSGSQYNWRAWSYRFGTRRSFDGMPFIDRSSIEFVIDQITGMPLEFGLGARGFPSIPAQAQVLPSSDQKFLLRRNAIAAYARGHPYRRARIGHGTVELRIPRDLIKDWRSYAEEGPKELDNAHQFFDLDIVGREWSGRTGLTDGVSNVIVDPSNEAAPLVLSYGGTFPESTGGYGAGAAQSFAGHPGTEFDWQMPAAGQWRTALSNQAEPPFQLTPRAAPGAPQDDGYCVLIADRLPGRDYQVAERFRVDSAARFLWDSDFLGPRAWSVPVKEWPRILADTLHPPPPGFGPIGPRGWRVGFPAARP